MQLRGGVRVQSGRAVVCPCMRPPRRGECSDASHWLAGCDSVTGQDAFEYAGTMGNEKAVGVLVGAVESSREGCGPFAWLLQTIPSAWQSREIMREDA